MKSIIKPSSVDLKKVKDLEYQVLFREEVERNPKYYGIDQEERESLIYNVSRIALSVVSCSDSLVARSCSKSEGLDILQSIYDEQIGNHTYEALFRAGKIKEKTATTDQLLIKLYSKEDIDFKQALKFLKALPTDLDFKPYKDCYLEYCRKVVEEIQPCVIAKYQREIEQEKKVITQIPVETADTKQKRSVRFADQVQDRATFLKAPSSKRVKVESSFGQDL